MQQGGSSLRGAPRSDLETESDDGDRVQTVECTGGQVWKECAR